MKSNKYVQLISLVLLIFLITSQYIVTAQTRFDDGIKELAEDLIEKVGNKDLERIAVWNFIDQDESHSKLAEYIAEEFSVHFTNNNVGFNVIDRQYLNQILDEHKLTMSGFVDEETAQEIGKFSGAQAIVVGRFSVLGNSIKIWVKVLDAETAMQVAASTASLPVDNLIKELVVEETRNPLPLERPGFNENGDTNATDREDEDADEAVENGVICFKSLLTYYTKVEIILTSEQSNRGMVTLPVHGEECIYELPPGVYLCKVRLMNGDRSLQEFQIQVKSGETKQKNIGA